MVLDHISPSIQLGRKKEEGGRKRRKETTWKT
jgi:hypothetical protein